MFQSACFKIRLFACLLLTLSIALMARQSFAFQSKKSESQTQERSADDSVPKLDELVGKVVDVHLKNNSIVADATVIAINEGKPDHSIKSLKIKKPNVKRPTQFVASKVSEIYIGGVPMDVIYDRKNRCLIHSVEKRIDRVAHRREVTNRLNQLGHRYWNPLTDAEHEKFMTKHRAFIKKTKSEMSGTQFRLVETQYFLFLTDLQPAEVNGYIAYLDLMYSELCKAFGLSPDKNIWCGKCVVVAFKGRQDFINFEAKLMRNPNAAGAQGLCHQSSDGTVIFSGYKGDSSEAFGTTLVHETTHGFVHRYMSTARAPSWLNEGMSDWMANMIVKGNSKIPTRQKRSAELVARRGWGDFLTTKRIDGDLYGSASALVEILLARDKGGQFKQFFDAIKEGHPADEALKMAFKISYNDLKILYAQRIRATGR